MINIKKGNELNFQVVDRLRGCNGSGDTWRLYANNVEMERGPGSHTIVSPAASHPLFLQVSCHQHVDLCFLYDGNDMSCDCVSLCVSLCVRQTDRRGIAGRCE